MLFCFVQQSLHLCKKPSKSLNAEKKILENGEFVAP